MVNRVNIINNSILARMIRNKIENTPITNIRKEEENATTGVTLAFLKRIQGKTISQYLNMWMDCLNSTTHQKWHKNKCKCEQSYTN